MKIKLDYQKIKDQDEETYELFREFIDRVVAGEAFAGRDPQEYDLIDITADIEIEIETEDERDNQNGMTDRNGNEFIRLDESGDEDNDDYINELERKNALLDDEENQMKLIPIRETGGGRTGTVEATYDEIVAIVGKPNVTDMDDPDKVKASWGFQDKKTKRKGFIWSYHYYGNIKNCKSFSADGDPSLMTELFGEKYSKE